MVLGYDASGIVEAVGPECTLFRPGDAVFYAGVLDRQGSNAELQLVDERITGRKPESLGHADAAALPLTTLTAWEMLFDRLAIPQDRTEGEALLVLGGAGGVPLHRHPARPGTDRADRHRHRLPARERGLGAGARRASRGGPRPAAGGTGEGPGRGAGALRVLDPIPMRRPGPRSPNSSPRRVASG